MSEETVQSKKKFDLTSYGVVVGFLSIEVLAFLSFNLGQSFILYGTGLPNQFGITERVEEYFKEGKDVLVVTLSSGMSGTYNSFLSIKDEMEQKYPGRKLRIVDSKRYSGGISILCIMASLNRDKGIFLAPS